MKKQSTTVEQVTDNAIGEAETINLTPDESAAQQIENLLIAARLCLAEFIGEPCIVYEDPKKTKDDLPNQTVREYQLACECACVSYFTKTVLEHEALAAVPHFSRVATLLCDALRMARYPMMGGDKVPHSDEEIRVALREAIDEARTWLKVAGVSYEEDLTRFDWIDKNPEY